MKNSKTFLNTLTLGCRLKAYIVIGISCYVVLLSITALVHNHTGYVHTEDTCTACFYNSQHVGIEIESFTLASPLLCSVTFPLYEAVSLPLRLTTNTRSRAPPVFSNELSTFVY
jgi:hypothetical protein